MGIPPGFDVDQLVTDFTDFAVPVLSCIALIFAGVIIYKVLKKL